MTVLLTSFKRYNDDHLDMRGYSIAVYQPRWYKKLQKIDLFDIRDETGQWTLPRNFVAKDGQPKSDNEILRQYHDKLVAMYEQRLEVMGELPTMLYEDVALCCWCPYEKAAKRQLETYGTFVCHSVAVETFLKRHGITVVRDEDRERMVRI